MQAAEHESAALVQQLIAATAESMPPEVRVCLEAHLASFPPARLRRMAELTAAPN
jgi:hypothetical protein